MMLRYSYTDADGNTIECEFDPKGDIPDSVRRGGKTFDRDLRADLANIPNDTNWPLECVASGVNAEDAGKLRNHFRKNGLNIDVSPDGNPIYKSNVERRKALRCRGMIDKSSYL